MKNGKKLFAAVAILASSTVDGWAKISADPVVEPDATASCKTIEVTVVGGQPYTCYCKDRPQGCTPPSGTKECNPIYCNISSPPPSPGPSGD
jgi:hypothetical protein